MAEGFGRKFFGDIYNIYSAGIEKHGMNQNAIKVMKELGVDLTGHSSKTLEELGAIHFDYVFTVCGHANENCPIFLGKAKVIHVGFDDPPKLARGLTDEAEILKPYRRVRDEIESFAKKLTDYLD
jgi:arsenate reductase